MLGELSLSIFRDIQKDRIEYYLALFQSGLSNEGIVTLKEVASEVLGLLIEDNSRELLLEILAALSFSVEFERANNQSSKPSVRFGYRLGLFLGKINAKSAQALSSFDDAPMEWIPGLTPSKSGMFRLPDDKFAELFRAGLSEPAQALYDSLQIRVGEFIGSGAYAEVRGLFVATDARKQLSIPEGVKLTAHVQIPGAGEKARIVYEFILKFLSHRGERRIGTLDPIGLMPIIREFVGVG